MAWQQPWCCFSKAKESKQALLLTGKIICSTMNRLFALYFILIQDARLTVQTEQTVNHWVSRTESRTWQQSVFSICGTVVCSADVFYTDHNNALIKISSAQYAVFRIDIIKFKPLNITRHWKPCILSEKGISGSIRTQIKRLMEKPNRGENEGMNPYKILIIEDDAKIRDELQILL